MALAITFFFVKQIISALTFVLRTMKTKKRFDMMVLLIWIEKENQKLKHGLYL